MNSAVQRQVSDESQTAEKAAPDWMKNERGLERRDHEQKVEGEGFVELKYRSLDNIATAKMAKGIGMFSIALGLAEMLMPARMGEAAGVSNRFRTFLPVLGAREIAHGLAIMSSPKPTTAVWSRVGGDVIDLAYLAAAAMGNDTNKRRLAGAAVAVLGVTALDIICAQKLSNSTWNESNGNPKAPTTVGQSSARRTAGA